MAFFSIRSMTAAFSAPLRLLNNCPFTTAAAGRVLTAAGWMIEVGDGVTGVVVVMTGLFSARSPTFGVALGRLHRYQPSMASNSSAAAQATLTQRNRVGRRASVSGLQAGYLLEIH